MNIYKLLVALALAVVIPPVALGHHASHPSAMVPGNAAKAFLLTLAFGCAAVPAYLLQRGRSGSLDR